MHEGVYNFCLAQMLLKSSFQNLGLLVLTITCQVFSLNLTVRGVSNKHCLLTFFIFLVGDDKDYEPWMAHSQHRINEKEDVAGCLLGVKESFLRLKKDAW